MRTLMAAICFSLCLSGCGQRQRPVTVLVSGDTHGWITPCGCAANQSGGLARRATLAKDAARISDTLLLDAGGAALGTSPYQRLKFESLLRGMKLMDIAAVNIGGSETEFDPDALREIGAATGVEWLCSNLRDHNGTQVGKSVLNLNRGGLNVAVAGVIDPSLVVHSDWQTSEPVQAILKAFAGSKPDVRIVLAYLDEGGLRSLAESLPEVDYIIGGPTGQALSPTRVGTVTIMSATNKGKFLASATLKRNEKEFEQVKAEIREVSSTLPEDQVQLKNLKAYYSNLAEHDFPANEAGLVTQVESDKSGYAIAGSSSCVSCHKQDDAVWHNSKHSHAWEVLVNKRAHFDPHCQQCHTTGYGQQGGFVSVAKSTELVHVGCENCHGPSQAHVQDATRRTPFQAKEQCQRCHDHENSPQFVLDAYWTRVFHQGKKGS